MCAAGPPGTVPAVLANLDMTLQRISTHASELPLSRQDDGMSSYEVGHHGGLQWEGAVP